MHEGSTHAADEPDGATKRATSREDLVIQGFRPSRQARSFAEQRLLATRTMVDLFGITDAKLFDAKL
jgi:hypothetical protein